MSKRVGDGRRRCRLVLRAGGACLLAAALACCLAGPARAETITRRHLDAGRIEFSGIDLNGDGIPDAITQDNLKKTTTCFLADERRTLKRIDPLALPEEERRLIPDVLTEQDLDGDEVRDLLIYNREYLRKYAGNEAVLARILANAIYIGQAKDAYQSLNGLSLAPEARAAILGRAREAAQDRP
jgi:hypothetical protein